MVWGICNVYVDIISSYSSILAHFACFCCKFCFVFIVLSVPGRRSELSWSLVVFQHSFSYFGKKVGIELIACSILAFIFIVFWAARRQELSWSLAVFLHLLSYFGKKTSIELITCFISAFIFLFRHVACCIASVNDLLDFFLIFWTQCFHCSLYLHEYSWVSSSPDALSRLSALVLHYAHLRSLNKFPLIKLAKIGFVFRWPQLVFRYVESI